MSATRQAVVEDVSLITQRLPTLLDYIRNAGFALSPEQIISVHDLIVVTNVQHTRPTNLYDYAGLIAPLVCRTPDEQQRFHVLFKEWLTQQGVTIPSAVVTPLPARDTHKRDTGDQTSDPTSLQKKTRLWPFALAGAVLVGAIYFYLYYIQVSVDLKQVVTPPPITLPPDETGTIADQSRLLESEKFPLQAEQRQIELTQPISGDEIMLAIANSGNFFVTRSDNTANIWDAQSGALQAVLTGHTQPIEQLDVSADSQRILTVGLDNSARVWDAISGRLLATLQHDDRIKSARFSSDGTQVVTASMDGSARLWNAASGKLISRIPHEAPVNNAEFSPDARYVATVSNENVALWDLKDNAQVWTVAVKNWNEQLMFAAGADADGINIRFSADGNQLILSAFNQAFQIWDANNGRLIRSIEVAGIFAEFTADANAIIGISWNNLQSNGTIWDTASGKAIRQLQGEIYPPLGFSPDGQYVTAASNDNYVRTWDLSSGKVVFEQAPKASAIGQAKPSMSQNGGKLANYSSIEALPTPPPSPWSSAQTRYTVAAVPVIIALLWALWLAWRKHLWLQRRASTGTPTLHELTFDYDEQELWHGESLKRGLQHLRRHQTTPTRRLNVPASVEATVRHAGYFQAVYANRPAQPEYLILVDHLHAEDYLRQLADTWISRIRREGLFVNVFYFYQDPRVCYHETTDEAVSLVDLSARHEQNRLLIISDAAGLFHPITGQTLPWISQLQTWKSRAMVTPRAGDRWGYQERKLIKAGFAVVPLDEAGLNTLGEHFSRDQLDGLKSPYLLRPCPPEPLPELLNVDDERWLHDSPPSAEILNTLILQLKRYLGPQAYLLFSACAVYPNLDWKLTLYLDRALIPGANLKEPRHQHLLRLSRLVWFRHGYLPDYLRLFLIQQLHRRTEKRIRNALHQLLKQVLSPSKDGVKLPVATDESRGTPRWLRDFLRTVPDNDPLSDHIFVTTLRGNRLSVALPRLLNRWFPGQLDNLKRALWLIALFTATGLSYLTWTVWPTWFPATKPVQGFKVSVNTVSLWPDVLPQASDSQTAEAKVEKPPVQAQQDQEQTAQQQQVQQQQTQEQTAQEQLAEEPISNELPAQETTEQTLDFGETALNRLMDNLQSDIQNGELRKALTHFIAIAPIQNSDISTSVEIFLDNLEQITRSIQMEVTNRTIKFSKSHATISSYYTTKVNLKNSNVEYTGSMEMKARIVNTPSGLKVQHLDIKDVSGTNIFNHRFSETLADQAYNRGAFSEAAQHYFQAQDYYKVVLGEQDIRVATMWRKLGDCYQRIDGGLDRSAKSYQAALDILTVIVDENHPDYRYISRMLDEVNKRIAASQESAQNMQQQQPQGNPYITEPISLAQLSVPYTATYEYEKSGIVIAEAKQTLKKADNDEYTLEVSAKAKGIASLFLSKESIQRSTWSQKDNRIVPIRFYENNATKKTETKLIFDWDYEEVSNEGDKPWSLPLDAGMVDKLLLQHLLRLDVQGATRDFSYQVPDAGKIKTYTIEIIGEETLKTTIGTHETIKVTSSRNKRTTTFWLAKALRLLPVRMEQTKSGKTESVITITNLKFDERPQATQKKPSQREIINRAWQQDVLPFYEMNIKNRYPFSKTSEAEVRLEDFNQFFGYGGILDRFFQQYLSEHVEAGRNWQWKNKDESIATISPGVLRMFRTASTIRSAYFPNKSDTTIWRFNLKPTRLNAEIAIFSLSLGEQRISYRHGPSRAKTLQWPPPGPPIGTQLSFEPIKGKVSGKRYRGPWAWFRLLGDSSVRTTQVTSKGNVNNKSTWRIVFSTEGYQAGYELTSPSQINPLSAPDLSQFTLIENFNQIPPSPPTSPQILDVK